MSPLLYGLLAPLAALHLRSVAGCCCGLQAGPSATYMQSHLTRAAALHCSSSLGSAAVLESPYNIRVARWPEDYERVCKVREPNAFVVEDGGVGFMGRRVELDPEEAQRRRVAARLGSALRDNATVVLAVQKGTVADLAAEDEVVIGTVDCLPLEAGKGRRVFATPLPARSLVRNLWVSPEQRRRGIARALMEVAEAVARGQGHQMISLEVSSENSAALALYADLDYSELDVPVVPLPDWIKGGTLLLGKHLASDFT